MSQILYTPLGETVAPREVKEVPMAWMQLLSHLSATWCKADGAAFGIHCSKCGKDVAAGNGITDRVLTAKCGCSEYYAKRGETQ